MAVNWNKFFSLLFSLPPGSAGGTTGSPFPDCLSFGSVSAVSLFYSAQVPLRKMAALLPSGRKPVILRSSAPTMKST